MSTNTPLNLSELPIYQKALEIFALSQNISVYLNHDLSNLKPDGSEDNDIYFSGDIIQQSVHRLVQDQDHCVHGHKQDRSHNQDASKDHHIQGHTLQDTHP